MSLSLNNLKAPHRDAKRKRVRVGRGNASGIGTYSGRGIKGQKSRSGVGGLKIKGLRRRLLQIPKLRGFTGPKDRKFSRGHLAEVNLSQLEAAFEANAIVSPKSLTNKQLIQSPRHGVKILGEGNVSKPFIVRKCHVSASAKEKIEKAGGKIES